MPSSAVELKTMIETFEGLKNIDDVLNIRTPTIGSFCTKNEVKTKGLLKIMIVKFDMFINMKNSLTDEHVDFIVNTIVTNYKWLTLADLCFVLKEAKMGKYGNLYERLSPMQFFRWMDEYFERRCECAENRSIRDSERYK